MIRDNTRRAFLQSIGATTVTGIPTRSDDEAGTSTGDATLSATDLVISDSDVPLGFESSPTPDNNSFIDILNESSLGMVDTDIAVQGYWKGGTQSDPEWVLSTLAIVADGEVPRSIVETAAQQSYDEYVTAFEAETGPMIDFKQSHTRNGQSSDWRVEITQTLLFSDLNDGEEHIYTDYMRQQFFGNVVLGTIVFGPTDTDPSIESLLTEFATMQRNRYKTHGTSA